MRTSTGGLGRTDPPSFGERAAEVLEDHCCIDLLSGMDVGAVGANVSEGTASKVLVRLVQPRLIADQQQLDTAAHSEPMVSISVGASFCNISDGPRNFGA